MEFNIFKNGADYLEYIQIFIFYEIFVAKKPVNEISTENYGQFELTDKLIEHYNRWVGLKCPNKEVIEEWVENNLDSFNSFRDNFGSTYKPKVAIWSDRKKTDYYKEKLQDAFLFENHIAKILQDEFQLDLGQYLTPEGQYNLGENALGIEIKNDTLIAKYGNVYIEYQEKSRSSNDLYVNSGILKDDNCIYFLIGTEKQFWIFRKARLLEIYYEELEIQKKGGVSNRGIVFKKIATSKGFVYPVKNAVADTISLKEMVDEILQK